MRRLMRIESALLWEREALFFRHSKESHEIDRVAMADLQNQ